jgi:inner membrane protein
MAVQSSLNWIRTSQFVRIVLVGFLILMLQIPILFLEGLVSERQNRYYSATSDITSSWGMAQTIVGPQLAIPYITRTVIPGKDDEPDKIQTHRKQANFLPQDLNIIGQVATEIRYRGLFQVPVYQANLQIQGEFTRPDFSIWNIPSEDVLWDEAELSFQITDARAIQNQAVLTWNEVPIALEPGTGLVGGDQPGIHANLRQQMTGDRFEFTVPLELNGSERLFFTPFGEVTEIKLSSDWADPSFQGPWLPSERTITDNGFEATWDIPSLGRGYPQQWNSNSPIAENLFWESHFGVDFLSPVDNYRMVRRSVKYNFLFMVLTFAVFWLFEVIVRLRVHPLQYLLVGTAMCLFYLLQLALSEHIGFQNAYIAASTAVVVMITAYSIAVLKANQRGITIGATQITLYTYLYIVLAHQDYALLIGSIGLFLFLAIVMFLTRKIDWFEPN